MCLEGAFLKQIFNVDNDTWQVVDQTNCIWIDVREPFVGDTNMIVLPQYDTDGSL